MTRIRDCATPQALQERRTRTITAAKYKIPHVPSWLRVVERVVRCDEAAKARWVGRVCHDGWYASARVDQQGLGPKSVSINNDARIRDTR